MKRILYITFTLILILSIAGCDNSYSANYKVVSTLSTDEFSLIFRSGDKLGEITQAALKVMAADGTLAGISQRWFSRDIISLEGDAEALDIIEYEIPKREFIMGVKLGTPPLGYKDSDGTIRGFDVDVAELMCSMLGWDLKLLPISLENTVVELTSGNVDCVWGASAIPGAEDKVDISQPYVKSRKVLVVRQDSGIRSKSGLKDRSLGMTYDPSSQAALDADKDLFGSLRSYTKFGSTEECFNALAAGECDAILIDELSANYFILQ